MSPYDSPGTQVRISFDARNADVTLMTNRSYGLEKVLATAKKISLDIGLPKADFIIGEGLHTVTADIELNDYLNIEGKQTNFALDISALATALRDSGLPVPITIGLETEDANRVILNAPGGSRVVDGYWFADPNDVKPGTTVRFEATIHWYAYLVLAFMACVLLSPLIIASSFLRKKNATPTVTPEVVLTPEDYDKGNPLWVTKLLFLLPLIFLIGNPKKLINEAFLLIPFSSSWIVGTVIVVFGVFVFALNRVTRRISASMQSKTSTEEPDPSRVFLQPFTFMIVLGPILMALMFLPSLFPTIPPEWLNARRYIALGLITISTLGLALSMFFSGRKLRTKLTSGPWYEMVMELSAKAGVSVKRVVLMRSSTVNAYASLFGTVGLTKGLIEKLEADEVRAVIAHELGHLKHGHVKRTFAISLITLAVVWGAHYRILNTYFAKAAPNVQFALNSPLVFVFISNLIVIAIVGPGRRRREKEADGLAVEWTGDPELVIRALTKVHTLNNTPHRLRPSDEALSTHPSLINRIDAIRTSNRPGNSG